MVPDAAPGPVLVVHAGAWEIPPEERAAHREGVRAAVAAGWAALARGASALEGVRLAVASMEDDPALNAGRGSALCREGWVEMDAGIMDGTTRQVGAVACVRDVANPVRLALEVYASDHVLLSGAGATALARERGLALCDADALVVPRERKRLAAWRSRRAGGAGSREPADTVGAVARDAAGCLAAATSTGGRVGKRSGRIGDAPIPGCGFWADDAAGAACCSGWGEHILRTGLARWAVELAREHAAQDACWMAVRELRDRVGGCGGLVLVGRDGSLGYAFNTPAMAVAWRDADVADVVVAGMDAAGR
jgi:L-asparaginase / beta-aspartyl-peptidase